MSEAYHWEAKRKGWIGGREDLDTSRDIIKGYPKVVKSEFQTQGAILPKNSENNTPSQIHKNMELVSVIFSTKKEQSVHTRIWVESSFDAPTSYQSPLALHLLVSAANPTTDAQGPSLASF
ncbi:hypothetical protein M1146_06255 [Patescibacteria group bacterium]|nr:hypothetical protein [Patescibacteria group bacterium]